jgi:hypothetical protein
VPENYEVKIHPADECVDDVHERRRQVIEEVILPLASTKALDVQVGGNHYKDMIIQPIEFTMKNNLNFCQGNIIKYVTRYKHKNGIEDLKKAKHYIDLLIQLEFGDQK